VGPVSKAAELPQTLWEHLKLFVRDVLDDDLPGSAATMTYYYMLSLFPALILLVAMIQSLPLDQPLENLSEKVSEVVPGEAGDIINEYIQKFADTRPSGLVSLWGIVVIWAASKGIAGARRSLNRVMGVRERRSPVVLRILYVALTIGAFVFVGVAYTLLVGGPALGRWLGDWVGLGEEFASPWQALHGTIAVALLLVFVMLAYWFLPGTSLKFRYLIAGALPAVIGWIVLGLGFRYWLANFGNYDKLYGSLASVIILMVFIWGSSIMFLFGAEVASNLADARGRLHSPKA
jgi:membrane protein